MDYYLLADLAGKVGYQLAMTGAETFRVEDTVSRILRAYGVECQVFAIPNSLTVSFETDNGKPMTILLVSTMFRLLTRLRREPHS